MRIDGSTFAALPDRSARTGAAVTPFRGVQRADVAREQDRPRLGQDSVAPAASAEPDLITPNSQWLSARAPEARAGYAGSLSLHAATALASYGSTANMVSNLDATEVLGLDLYA